MAAPYLPPAADGPRFLLATAVEGGGSGAAEAIALVGGTIAGRVSLSGAADACAHFDGAVVLDLAGGEDAAVHAGVSAVGVVAAARGLPVVIAMTIAQIDLVFDAARDGTPALLCEPDQAEWARALLTAGLLPREGDGLRDPGGEAERLARLRAEVARIAETLARLGGNGDGPRGASDRRPTFDAAPGDAAVGAAEVRDVIKARRMRDRFFGPGLFEDPAWDVLLDLFAAELEQVRVSVSSLCIAAAVAPTTALRWIARMTEGGLLERASDPLDRRRAFVMLSPRAGAAMRGYVAAVRAVGLPLV